LIKIEFRSFEGVALCPNIKTLFSIFGEEDKKNIKYYHPS
jgi:hypothetical protein